MAMSEALIEYLYIQYLKSDERNNYLEIDENAIQEKQPKISCKSKKQTDQAMRNHLKDCHCNTFSKIVCNAHQSNWHWYFWQTRNLEILHTYIYKFNSFNIYII